MGPEPSTATASTKYRIKLRDGGEPGTDDVYEIFIPDVGYSWGDQTLEGANVQIG